MSEKVKTNKNQLFVYAFPTGIPVVGVWIRKPLLFSAIPVLDEERGVARAGMREFLDGGRK